MIGQCPEWNYGHNASFGLWVQPVKGSKLFVCLYSGVIFSRCTTFVWEELKDDAEGFGETPVEDDGKPTFDFKMKIKPSLKVVPPCGSLIPYPDFPIFVFASEGKIVYTDEQMKSFKRFGDLNKKDFYSLVGEAGADTFDLPELDSDVYDGSDEELEETKRGLLVPLYMISVEKEDNGGLRVSEVLDMRASDTFAFAEKEAEEDPGSEPGDPCERDGEEPADGRGYPPVDPEMPETEPGESDRNDDEDPIDPCPEEE